MRAMPRFQHHLLVVTLCASLAGVSTPASPWVGEARADLATDLGCPGCNVIIVSLTNTRKDHIGLYGGKRPTTPNVDRFFSDAILFDSAFAPASWTLPVAASLLTSVYPYSHGVMNRYGNSRLSDDYLTLAELFKAQGYQTAAFTGGGDYHRRFNLAQGFDTYVDEVNVVDYVPGPALEEAKVGNLIRYLGIERLVPPAVDWITEHHERKMFLLVQGYDTHCPFTPKPPYDKMFAPGYTGTLDFSSCFWTFDRTEPIFVDGQRRWPVKISGKQRETLMTDRDVEHMLALYDGEIAQADSYLAALFKALDAPALAARTIVIFMSEHGDLFGEHGRFMRGGPLTGTFYDPVLNFPLLVKHPKIKGPVRVNAFMESIDLLPTLTEILQIGDPKRTDRQGKSMVPFIVSSAEAGEGSTYVFAASYYVGCNSAYYPGTSLVEVVHSREWKLFREAIYDGASGSRSEVRYQLFNLRDDPGEDHDLYTQRRDVATALERVLRERFPKPPVDETAPPCPPQQMQPGQLPASLPGGKIFDAQGRLLPGP
jgi:arylsulfatase A-like enzyme